MKQLGIAVFIIMAMGMFAACSGADQGALTDGSSGTPETVTSSTATYKPVSRETATAAPASVALTGDVLGGLDLNRYCASMGSSGASLRRSRLGVNAAFDNWYCTGSSGTMDINSACQWQYGNGDVVARAPIRTTRTAGCVWASRA